MKRERAESLAPEFGDDSSLLQGAFNPARGRHVTATTRVAAGTLLLSEKPLAAIALKGSELCDHCLNPPAAGRELIRCEACCLVMHCSASCAEDAAASYHRPSLECDALQKVLAAIAGDNPERLDDATHRFLIRVLAVRLSRLPSMPALRLTTQLSGVSEKDTDADTPTYSQQSGFAPFGAEPSPTPDTHGHTLAASLLSQGGSSSGRVGAAPGGGGGSGGRRTARQADYLSRYVPMGPPPTALSLPPTPTPAASSASHLDVADAIKSLQGHVPSTESEEYRWLQDTAGMLAFAAPRLAEGLRVTDLVQILCCINRNSMTMYASEEEGTVGSGMGLFLQATRLNHSCRPNCEFYNIGEEIHVRAVADIEAGEEVTISYVPDHHSLMDRRRALLLQYKFECCCSRCVEEEGGGGRHDGGGGGAHTEHPPIHHPMMSSLTRALAHQPAGAADPTAALHAPPPAAEDDALGMVGPEQGWRSYLERASASLEELRRQCAHPHCSTKWAGSALKVARQLSNFAVWRKSAVEIKRVAAGRAALGGRPGGISRRVSITDDDGPPPGAPGRGAGPMEGAGDAAEAVEMLKEVAEITQVVMQRLGEALHVFHVTRGAHHPIVVALEEALRAGSLPLRLPTPVVHSASACNDPMGGVEV